MSEKRFELDVRLDMPKLLIDNATNKRYHLLLVNDIEEIVDRLNEQQATIQSLKEENRKLRNIHLSIDLNYSYGYGRYLADVRVIDNE